MYYFFKKVKNKKNKIKLLYLYTNIILKINERKYRIIGRRSTILLSSIFSVFINVILFLFFVTFYT
jgi:hypothetical protein